ncbi:hypothetical protein BOX15_Mlig007839g3 [Macrostomum lignano]|uniref:uracil phosphoribosyltransferase n=2 Tax=Macrostomum lignano TaxID=282301 RepID=A0A1I8JDL6_9PLAT|nr:hypothetical protein BOX15_Mlig007839g3 [Macrostomum lignano]
MSEIVSTTQLGGIGKAKKLQQRQQHEQILSNGGSGDSATDVPDTALSINGSGSTLEPVGSVGNIRVLRATSQLKELHTLLRDKDTSRSDFVFYADRLIRLVVEEALNCLPYEPLSVVTPGGHKYDGLRYTRGNCGVSVMRSGEAMEKGLRDCCRAIRIGKMLIQLDNEHADSSAQPEPVYVKLPPGIQQRRVLLMYPVLGDGRVAAKALQLLVQDYAIPESSIFLLNLFSTKLGVDAVLSAFPNVTVLTSELHDLVPYHFCAKYFGTD